MSSQTTLPPWLPVSYILSQHLVEDKLHKRFLTSNERKYFQDALSSFATWIGFINQHHTAVPEIETAAFRVRSMLYEQYIPHLFHTNRPCCKAFDLDPLLEQARLLSIPSSEVIHREWQSYLDSHIKKSIQNTDDTKQEGIHINTCIIFFYFIYTTCTASTPNTNNKEEPTIVTDNVPLRDIFHTLESDRAAMIEQRKLEVNIYIYTYIIPIFFLYKITLGI